MRIGVGGKVEWATDNGFQGVLRLWEALGGKMMNECKAQCKRLQYDVKAAGRDEALWEHLFNFVKEGLHTSRRPRATPGVGRIVRIPRS
jgi:hypothetical protein